MDDYFAPLSNRQMTYHAEHHAWPSVPFYHLPSLHDAIRQRSITLSKCKVNRPVFVSIVHRYPRVRYSHLEAPVIVVYMLASLPPYVQQLHIITHIKWMCVEPSFDIFSRQPRGTVFFFKYLWVIVHYRVMPFTCQVPKKGVKAIVKAFHCLHKVWLFFLTFFWHLIDA